MRVGVIGIGNMGFAIVERLRALGWRVAVRDIDAAREAAARELGATSHPTPALLAAASDLIIVAVVDAAQTNDVLFGTEGAASALRTGASVILCPTIGPADVESFAQALGARGLGCIDAPMSGGPRRAREGTMSLMVAGDPDLIDRHGQLFEALSNQIFRIGPRPGDGARTKLVNNLLAAVNLAGAAEALALATRLGLDPARTLDVMQASSGQSWIGNDRLRRALALDPAVLAHMGLLAKDSALALAMAAAAGVPVPQGAQAHRAFAAALEAGCGAEDDAAIYRLALKAPCGEAGSGR